MVDAAQVTERTITLLQPVAESAGVSVEKTLKTGCTILCTGDDLSQICFNLVENAIKYNYRGGKVFVSVYRDGDQVLLEVGDTGVGIPEEDLPKVFNRFYRPVPGGGGHRTGAVHCPGYGAPPRRLGHRPAPEPGGESLHRRLPLVCLRGQ